jgi:hypothetical protein
VREAEHSPPFSAAVKNAWNYTSITPIRLHVVVIDNFTFSFTSMPACSVLAGGKFSLNTLIHSL